MCLCFSNFNFSFDEGEALFGPGFITLGPGLHNLPHGPSRLDADLAIAGAVSCLLPKLNSFTFAITE